MTAVKDRPVKYRKATHQDVLDAPPNKIAQVIGGTLHLMSRPASLHAAAVTSLGDELLSPFQKGRGGPGDWWLVFEPELHLGDDILVPDLAGWHRARMPDYPDVPHFILRPDWVCEVLSPSTRGFDLNDKRDIYARQGLPYLWVIDPKARTLEAFRLHGHQWLSLGVCSKADPVSLPPFEAVTFPLNTLWPGG